MRYFVNALRRREIKKAAGILRGYFKRIVFHPYERARYGYSWWDWINFNSYLADVIQDGTLRFITEGHGYPSDLTPEEWNNVLFRISEGFHLYGNKDGWLMNDDEKARVEDALDHFRERFYSLWD